jgi:hypothetical protein
MSSLFPSDCKGLSSERQARLLDHCSFELLNECMKQELRNKTNAASLPDIFNNSDILIGKQKEIGRGGRDGMIGKIRTFP